MKQKIKMLCLAVAAMGCGSAFAEPVITDGKLVIAAGETFDLATAAQPIELDRLENSGTLKNSSVGAITLTVTNCVLGGTVQDKINIVKVGDGAFALNNPDMSQMAGKLDIQSGSLTVTVDAWRALELPVKDGLSFHLDAADLGSLQFSDAGDRVTTWKDSSGHALDFKEETAPVGTMSLKGPGFDPSLYGGRGGLVFSANATETDGANRLSSGNGQCVVRSIFFFMKTDGVVVHSGLFGGRNYDCGIRGSDWGRWSPYSDWQNDGFGSWNSFFINGIQCSGGVIYPTDKAYVLQANANRESWTRSWALGQYVGGFSSGSGGCRGYIGSIGEVIAYSRLIEGADRDAITEYLTEKWTASLEANENAVLAMPSVSLYVGEGATVHLVGVGLTLGQCENRGTIVNAMENEAVLDVSSGVLDGAIKGNVRIVKRGEGSLTMDGAAIDSLPGGISVQGGTLAFKTWRALELPVKDGLSFHLDAADLGSLQFSDAGDRVTTWKDSSGHALDFKEETAPVGTMSLKGPGFDPSLYGGRGGLVFSANDTDTDGANRLSSGSGQCVVRSIFFFTKTDGVVAHSGLFGGRNYDCGIRGSEWGYWNPYPDYLNNGFVSGNSFFINGKQCSGSVTYPKEEAYVLQANANKESWTQSWALGQYVFNFESGSGGCRGYIGSIGEVIAYSRLIEGADRDAITEYLTKKWTEGGPNNPLGSGASLDVSNGATVDLGGTEQTFGGLSGNGGTIDARGTIAAGATLTVVPGENGTVDPWVFTGGVTFEGAAEIKVQGASAPAHIVLVRNVDAATDVAKIGVPDGWTLKLSDSGALSMARRGLMIIVK